MAQISKPTLAEIRARLAPVRTWLAPRIEQGLHWLIAPREPLTWAALRAKLAALKLPSTNAGRFAVLGSIILLLLLLLWLVLPWYWEEKPGEKGVTTYPHATLLNPILTVAAALAGGAFALMRHFQTIAADRQRRITETFSKAVEQLGSEKREVRTGGIYTLERLAREVLASPQGAVAAGEQSFSLYWTVMETLTAFVRERARWQEPDTSGSETVVRFYEDARADRTAATDIVAVLSVIRHRPEAGRSLEKKNGWRLNFSRTDLQRADLGEAHLENAVFDKANLGAAALYRVRLDRASLHEAHLERANLNEAYLEDAILSEAHLDDVRLDGAHLDRAVLEGARLDRAELRRAHLDGARLRGAHLESANLYEAHLDGVQGLDLAHADASTRLPEGYKRPTGWPAYKSPYSHTSIGPRYLPRIVLPKPQPTGE